VECRDLAEWEPWPWVPGWDGVAVSIILPLSPFQAGHRPFMVLAMAPVMAGALASAAVVDSEGDSGLVLVGDEALAADSAGVR
jgi:hypothetical protein